MALQHSHCNISGTFAKRPLPGCRSPAHLAARKRPLFRVSRAAADDDDDRPPQVSGDWRAFRAGLLAQDGQSGGVSSPNMELLRQQDPELADEPMWAHPVQQIERGGVLLASPRAPELLSDPRMWQLVVLILEHGPAGSVGVIINRPAFPVVSDLLDRPGVQGDIKQLALAFANNAIYLGGMYRPTQLQAQKLTMIHRHEQLLGQAAGSLSTCTELVPGLYAGGEVPASKAVLDGQLDPRTFRFFVGQLQWGPGQLAMEVNSGIWHTAACSRSLIVKQCLQLPEPLWREAMTLMGGEYAAAAAKEPRM